MNDLFSTVETSRLIVERRIALETQAFRLRRSFFALAWLRPVAVRAQTPEGELRLPIRDVTRRWQIAAYGFSLLCLVIGLSMRGREQKE